jgi:alkanesulfonate monooxygenase SsuD/methylene tetrahydromethanopterin reductase-like flavin-dependent oxidoreductase (luciferase family)
MRRLTTQGRMYRMTTLGAVCRPEIPPERLQDVARAAEDSGLDELWLWEDCFWGGAVATAAAVLAWAPRLRVGIGVLPVPLRNVALTAMETATLHRLFPGRVTVGVGHGVQDWMGQVGARAESPLTLLREHLAALRALLRGDRVTLHGRYVQLADVALGWPPATAAAVGAPPVLAAATGPRTLRLSGELADGTILHSGTTPEQLRLARELIGEGRAAAGRTDPHPLILYLLTATGANAPARLAKAMRDDGDQPGGASVAGEAPAVADAVRFWATAGADTVVLQPAADDPDPAGFVRFAAEQVRPLLGP